MAASTRELAPTQVQGLSVPSMLYGTAWKEDLTEKLVVKALEAGFRGIDTANQRKHYHEAGVGAALRAAFDSGLVRRDDLFLQTKFTPVRGQDHRLPYDAKASPAEQVAQSFASSLEHLGVETLDAYVLHGPSAVSGLGEVDWEIWRAMEALHAAGSVGLLGISNVAADQLEALHAGARVKPAIVQNRSFAQPRADTAVRGFCRRHKMAYEGFSLLTAIPHVLAHPAVREIADLAGHTPAQAVFAWCLSEGMVVLTGTTSGEHMTQDLAARNLALPDEARATLASLVLGRN